MKTGKAAVPGDEFIKSDIWKDVKELRTPNPHNAKTVFLTPPKFMVGHNRHATIGAINDRNAHPFTHGAITLCHNGTLIDQDLLPDAKDFEVDSENICHSINKIGAAETIQKLNGAFTLVWHNAEDKTLNIIRNDERPFHLVETVTGDWFGASEEDMILWIIKRKSTNPKIKRHFETVVGTQYIFDVSTGFSLKEEIVHQLPTFQYVYRGTSTYWGSRWQDSLDDPFGDDRSYYGGYYSGARGSSNTSPVSSAVASGVRKKDNLNDILYDHGIKVQVGERIKFSAYDFTAYISETPNGLGKLTGYYHERCDEYIEIHAHTFKDTDYVPDGIYTGEIVSCFVLNYVLTIVLAKCKPFSETLIPSDLEDDVLTEQGDDIPFDEDNDLDEEAANNQARFPAVIVDGVIETTCTDIHKAWSQARSEREKEMAKVNGRIESLRKEISDYDAFENGEDNPEQVETTKNGVVFTKKDWESNPSLNCCGHCGSPIQFDDAPDSLNIGDYNFCGDCHDSGCLTDLGFPANESTENVGTMRFTCVVCASDYPEDAESVKDETCIQCYNAYYNKPAVPARREILAFRRKARNGMTLTKTQWERINDCNYCGEKIDWKLIETTEFFGQSPCCESCVSKMDAGIGVKTRQNIKE